MKAIVLDLSSEEKIKYTDVQSRLLKPQEVRVLIKAAALNHRDEWCRAGMYPNLKDGIILGSDGAGVISELGEGVDAEMLGKEVIINPALNWGQNQKVQGPLFEILGMPNHGTLAESIIVPLDRVHPKPAHLSWEEAAALPLAGVTAYRAISYQGQLTQGETLLVTGFGGGVAQFVAQFGLAMGAKVYVSSSDPEKIAKALELGAIKGFNYQDHNWITQAQEAVGGFDLIIDSAAGDTLNHLVQVAKPGGKIVFFGATLGNPSKLEARKIFWNQLKIIGTTMGSDADFDGMLDLVTTHQIKPLVDSVFKFEQALEAFDRMRDGKQLGKIVLVP
jgi:NADPH:quinone reductase-like Zn-dependent oxidoreductase